MKDNPPEKAGSASSRSFHNLESQLLKPPRNAAQGKPWLVVEHAALSGMSTKIQLFILSSSLFIRGEKTGNSPLSTKFGSAGIGAKGMDRSYWDLFSPEGAATTAEGKLRGSWSGIITCWVMQGGMHVLGDSLDRTPKSNEKCGEGLAVVVPLNQTNFKGTNMYREIWWTVTSLSCWLDALESTD